MKVENENALNFKGDFIINSSLSSKPISCIKKVKNELQELISNKDYNLYLRQNFSTNEINIAAGKFYPFYNGTTIGGQNSISIESKYSKYVGAAKKTIDDYENELRIREQNEWEQQRNKQIKQDIIDDMESILYFPLFAIESVIHLINPKWSQKFDKLIDKII